MNGFLHVAGEAAMIYPLYLLILKMAFARFSQRKLVNDGIDKWTVQHLKHYLVLLGHA